MRDRFSPGWRDPRRADYTVRLAGLLALLAAPPLLAVGLAGALLTRLGQILSPGD